MGNIIDFFFFLNQKSKFSEIKKGFLYLHTEENILLYYYILP